MIGLRKTALLLAAGLVLLSPNLARAEYPERPITMIVCFGAGGGTDIAARVVSDPLSQALGKPVVVENRPGAGGNLGIQTVARAAPDGYTLLVNSNAHVVNPALYAHLPYDTFKDFVEIAPLTIAPNVFVVAPGSRYTTLMDVVRAAKAKPGALNIGHAGIGSSTHLNTERFIAAAKIKVTEVPYKGTPGVIAAVLSGDVEGYWCPISAAIPQLQAGKLRALAVSTDKRSAQLPNVPSVAEAGLKNAESALWVGVWAPAGTPRDIVNKVNGDVRKALSDTHTRANLFVLGNETMDMSPQQFAQYARSEAAIYARMLKAAGLKPQ